MKDTIIKGSGNSRTIRTVPNGAALYPTYEAFIEALAAGTLPVDLGPLSAAGVEQMGTLLNKANLLSDSTETSIFGSAADRTVDAALLQLRDTLELTQLGKAKVYLTVKSSAGKPVVGALVNGMTSGPTSGQVTTDANGQAVGYVSGGSVTLSITGYLDFPDQSESFTATPGTVYHKTWSITTRNFLQITATKNYKISSLVSTVDVCVVGGGYDGGSKGGDGGPVVTQTGKTFTANSSYTATVGAKNGGVSSFLGVTTSGKTRAVGGANATSSSYAETGANGKAGYSSYTSTSTYGGAGGGGGYSSDSSTQYATGRSGGTGGGGKGANASYSNGAGGNGAAGSTFGAGGGGYGTVYGYYDDYYQTFTGNGGVGHPGMVAVRIHFK